MMILAFLPSAIRMMGLPGQSAIARIYRVSTSAVESNVLDAPESKTMSASELRCSETRSEFQHVRLTRFHEGMRGRVLLLIERRWSRKIQEARTRRS